MADGVFAVSRGVFDHPTFADEPFTEREAWIWMIGEAAWRPHRARAGSVAVSLARGELAHSIRFMADKWKWHRARVDRFLKRLKTETMIETRAETGVTVVTICNYDSYQRVSLPSETPAETQNETSARQQRDRVEDREYREEKIFVLSDEPKVDETDQAFDAFNEAAKHHGWPAVVKRSSRKQLMRARIADAGGLQGFRDALARAGRSSFLTGRSGRTGEHENWRPDIDFFLQAKKFARLIEGVYDDRGTGPPMNGTKQPELNHHGDIVDWDARLAFAQKHRRWMEEIWGSQDHIPPAYRDRFADALQRH